MRVSDATRMRQPPRRLGVTHFAFYRAYLDGPSSVDQGELSQRYLDLSADPLRVAKTIRWLQDELSIAARRIGDRRAARLLRLPKSAFAPIEQDSPAAPAMSLETFQEQRDPDGFYSEAELLALYQEEVGAGAPVNRRAVRNVRLHQRRMAALSRLENVLVETPQLEHHVAGWFDAPIANRLAAVGLTTLAQLVGVINSAG